MAGLRVTIDQNDPLSFEGFLFNEPDQVKKQPSKTFHIFHLLNSDSNLAVARFVLFINEDKGESPSRAPFGSIEFDEKTSSEELDFFLKAIDEFSEEKKLSAITIVSYPFCYAPSGSHVLTYCFLTNGYNIQIPDLNFHLSPGVKEFESGLHDSEKRRLKKSQKEDYKFLLETKPDVSSMYQLIKTCRENKGYPISMTEDELKKIFSEHPDKYLAFTLRDKTRLIASVIGVRINSKVLYNFLPADDIEYKNFSPMVLLMKHMFDYCRDNSYEIFDLGIATAKGIPNHGLIRFKQNIGGEASLKLTFFKSYSS